MPLNIRPEGPVRIAPVTVQKAGDPSVAVRATAVEIPEKRRPERREDPTLASLANPSRVISELPMPVQATVTSRSMPFARVEEEAAEGPSDEGESYTEEGSSVEDSGTEGEDGPPHGGDRPFESMAARAERVRAEKTDLLNRLYDYARKGEVVPEHLGLRSTVEELKEAYDRIKNNVAKRASVKFQGRMLVTFVTGIELLNSNLDVVGPDLDGWSHTVMTEVTDYETAFEQLYDLYGKQFECHPLITVLLMLGLSGWNHMSFARKRRDENGAAKPQPPRDERAPPPRPQPPQASSTVPATRMSRVPPASTQAGPGAEEEPRQRERVTQPPAQPFNAAAGASRPPSNPYVMRGPSTLGVLPGFSPVSLNAATGPNVTAAEYPPSADLVIRAGEVTVPPRAGDQTTTSIVEVGANPAPRRGRPRKADEASEPGVQI